MTDPELDARQALADNVATNLADLLNNVRAYLDMNVNTQPGSFLELHYKDATIVVKWGKMGPHGGVVETFGSVFLGDPNDGDIRFRDAEQYDQDGLR